MTEAEARKEHVALARRDKQDLAYEIIALRQQVAMLQRTAKKLEVTDGDRVFWAWLSKTWAKWKDAMLIVTPETIIRWHREWCKKNWASKSKPKTKRGRPAIPLHVCKLIRKMARENPTWGAPHIHCELELLGYKLAQSTVGDYLAKIRPERPSGQSWETFLKNHLGEFAAADFFQVFMLNGERLFGFVVLHHLSRKILHFAATAKPTAEWTAQQLKIALQGLKDIKFLLHDRDPVFSKLVKERIEQLGIEDKKTAPKSPWQNPYVERVIGTFRRDLLDHVIVLNEAHFTRLCTKFIAYYHEHRTHLSLDRNAPIPRAVQPAEQGEIVSIPVLGGLHHRYIRRRVA